MVDTDHTGGPLFRSVGREHVELKTGFIAVMGLLGVDFQGLRVRAIVDTLIGGSIAKANVPVGVGNPRICIRICTPDGGVVISE